MGSQKRNKKINISENEYQILCLINEGLLGSCTHLMGKDERDSIVKGVDANSFPYPFTFYSVEYENVLKNTKINEELDLFCNDELVARLSVQSKFKNDKSIVGIFTPNQCDIRDIGETCVSGPFEVFNSEIKKIKQEFEKRKRILNAQNITGIITSLDPLHKGHERIFRWAIDKADLLVVFLIESFDNSGFNFELKLKYFNDFIKHYLPRDKIFVFPLKNIELFRAHLNPLLEGIISKNLGCTKLVVGQNHYGLSMFYDENRTKTMFDSFSQECGIEVVVLPEQVFCEKCKSIVSMKSCPHGSHHHVKFNSSALRRFLRLGIIVPTIFMRARTSNIILSNLFPNRFKNMQQMYNDLFTNEGILENRQDEDFYNQLLKLYQITHTV